MANNILVNINRCTGCWTCSMACKKAFGLGEDDYRMFVRTIGGGQIDIPGGKWPNLYMKWMPIFNKSCASCSGDSTTEGKPYCVYNCTTQALSFGDPGDPQSDFSVKKEELRQKQYRIYEMHPWENTREGIVYAEKDI
ncbi:MAG: hypothetical protein ACI36Y_03760 [Coriobacteriales bacterium]